MTSPPDAWSGGIVRVAEAAEGRLARRIEVGPHVLLADEPEALGGSDRGPNPYDLLLASLGSCTSMTLRLYADRKGWPLKSIAVTVSHQKIHAKDCAECETTVGKVDRIAREIALAGPLSDAQKARLLEIADMCPIHRTLKSEVNIRTSLKP